MVKRQFKKTMFLLMVFAMMLGVFSPMTSFAATNDTSAGINEDLKSKVDPFVYLDQETEEFKVKKEAKDVLTKEELKQVKEIIKTSNVIVKEHRSDLIIEGNKFVGKEPQQSASSGDFQTASIDKSKAFDYDFTWWGLRVYWSHGFVTKLQKNVLLYGAGTAALNATIAYFLSPPGWVTSFVTACAGIGLWAFIQQDKGCGVYLDCYLYVPTRWYSAC
ncbi:hypothetical protein P6P90_16950 [Ectobacillus antri]|uniref:Uncharacterized protein n=1 Tax=Ectobacillus antri TaxID=2486280 RepID=A0ABT6H8D3_9BACI|nr:hypothetical protein [Ectobacillus antri]MDG4658577.1 hypothetical protein [Ectobacillus antri]MDG5755581.1 hypothetical protein [Ectobacillus antri]